MPTPSWLELLVLVVHGPVGADGVPGPEPTLRGRIRSHRSDGDQGDDMGWVVPGGAPVPVLAGAVAGRSTAGTVLRVWRDGARVRVEDAATGARVVADEHTAWSFAGDPVPTASPRSALRLVGAGTQLLARRDAHEVAGDDFTRPTGPVGAATFLGRPAWTVELAPPPRKPHPLQLVVDAATGVVLQQRVDAVGAVDEWVDLAVGEPLDAALFTWSGPVRAAEDAGRAARAAHEAERAAWSSWFAAAVGPVELEVVVPVALDLSVRWVHTHDRATGAFEATLGDHPMATLARRPRSADPWDLGWSEVHHRWSTARSDWAFRCVDVRLTPEGLAAVERAFPDP